MNSIHQGYSSHASNNYESSQLLSNSIDKKDNQNEPLSPVTESSKSETSNSHIKTKGFDLLPTEVSLLILEHFLPANLYAFSQVSKGCLKLFYQNLCSRFHISISEKDSATKEGVEISRFLSENKNIVKYALRSDVAPGNELSHINIFYLFIHHIFFKLPLLKGNPLLLLQWIRKNEDSYLLTPQKCIDMGLFLKKNISIGLDENFSRRQSYFIIEQSLPILSQKIEISVNHFIKIPKHALEKGIVAIFSMPGGEQIVMDMLDSNMYRAAHRFSRKEQNNPAIWFFNKVIQCNATELERKRWKGWLKKCIDSGIRICPGEERQSLVYNAIDQGNEDKELIELILCAGADPNKTEGFRELPLHLAIKRDYSREIIDMLIKYGANPQPPDYLGKSVLYALFGKNSSDRSNKPDIAKNLAIAKAFFPKGGMYDKEHGNTALSIALQNYHDNPEVIHALLEFGEKPDQLVPYYYGYGHPKQFSALSMLCEGKWTADPKLITKIAELLIEYGANISIKNLRGTLLHQIIDASNFNSELFALLIQKGLDPNEKNENGDSPLHYAIKNRKRYLVKFLLENDADSTLADSNGNTALDLLLQTKMGSANEMVDTINFLFDHGAKPEHLKAQTWFNLFTDPIHFVSDPVDNSKAFCKVIKALVEKGVKLNATNDAKQSALHLSVQSKQFAHVFISALLQLGAKVDLKDINGKTPYDLASRNCRMKVNLRPFG